MHNAFEIAWLTGSTSSARPRCGAPAWHPASVGPQAPLDSAVGCLAVGCLQASGCTGRLSRAAGIQLYPGCFAQRIAGWFKLVGFFLDCSCLPACDHHHHHQLRVYHNACSAYSCSAHPHQLAGPLGCSIHYCYCYCYYSDYNGRAVLLAFACCNAPRHVLVVRCTLIVRSDRHLPRPTSGSFASDTLVCRSGTAGI